MYDVTMRERALALLDEGLTISETSRRTGIARSSIREWRLRTSQGRDLYARPRARCPRCAETPTLPEPTDSYAYLLGLYLGDGYISPVGDRDKKVWAIRIACANAWPGLIRQCAAAVSAVRPEF